MECLLGQTSARPQLTHDGVGDDAATAADTDIHADAAPVGVVQQLSHGLPSARLDLLDALEFDQDGVDLGDDGPDRVLHSVHATSQHLSQGGAGLRVRIRVYGFVCE